MENIKKSLEDLNLKVGTANKDFEVSDVVYTTTNLNIFKFMVDGNRPVDKKHVNQLKDRLSEKYLRTIVIVNEIMEIIDGQHRYTAIKELNEENEKRGLPLMSLEFIICKNYGVEECCQYNGKSKNWSNKNITEGGKTLNIEEYKIYDKFIKEFNLPHNVTVGLLSGVTTNTKNSDEFKNLKLEIKDVNESLSNANKIIDIVNTGIIPIGRSDQPVGVFGLALLEILLKVDTYDHDRMVRKCREYVEREGRSLRKLTNITEPLIEFEEVYNYKERCKDTFITEKRKNGYLFKQLRK